MQQEILISLQSKAQSKSFSSLKNRRRFQLLLRRALQTTHFRQHCFELHDDRNPQWAPDNDNTLFSRRGFFELPNQMGKNLIIKANDEDSLISFLVPKLIKLSKHSQSQYLQKISHFPLFLRVSVENPVCTTDLHDSFISRLLNRWS